MPRSADDLEQAAGGLAAQMAARFRLLLAARRDIAALFLAGGKAPTPEAARWLTRLARDNHVNSSAFHEDAREHARREGRRELALEIIAAVRLDPARLNALAEQMRENDDD